MRPIKIKNYLMLYFWLLMNILKRAFCKEFTISIVDPPHIKIENQGNDPIIHITLRFTDSFKLEEKANKYVILRHNVNNKLLNCSALEESFQDEEDEHKIIFKLNQELFWNKTLTYGKFKFLTINGDSINYEETLLIFFNDIKFKNPIHAYELTGDESKTLRIKYELSEEIEKDYINKILYIDESNPDYQNAEKNILNFEIKPKDNKNVHLIISFQKQNSPKNFIIFIFPEYDKNAKINEVQQIYLHFQDFIFLNDAIYLKRNNNDNSLVYFKAQFKTKEAQNKFYIKDYHSNQFYCDNFDCNQINCTCSFYLGKFDNPGQLTIEYSKDSSTIQKREIFLILYETGISRCYQKDAMIDLEITTYSSEEMEYDNFLYFNDTVRKALAKYERSSNSKIRIYKYTARSSSLNSGTFCLFSLIPDLTTNYDSSINVNFIDEFSLYFTIFPGKNLKEDKLNIIYTNNNTDQIIIFNLTNAGALDEIILQKEDELNRKIIISKSLGQCSLDSETIFKCNLKNTIYSYGNEYEGDYLVYYKSPCDKTEFMIEKRKITIKRGISLLAISPSYIFKDEVIGAEITLKYNVNMEGKDIYIYIFNTTNATIAGNFHEEIIVTNEFIKFKINKNLNEDFYYIKTRIGNGIPFDNKNIGLRIIPKITNFIFSHHYFVLNNNATLNQLIIQIDDNTNTFGCVIEEVNTNKNLTKDNCNTFYYNIYRTGQIFFNYYYKDSNEKIIVPINDNITVVSTYQSLFDFSSLKNCNYYKFEINIKFYNNLPKYLVFLTNENKNISFTFTENEIYTKYTYDTTKNSYLDFINNKYYLIVSEAYEDINIYLYKSKSQISFTDINVPEFLIKPNITINFNNVFCNLSESNFAIKNVNKELFTRINECKYLLTNKILSCEIQNSYFYNNNPFNYNIYTVDNEYIQDDNDNNNPKITFASNKLSDSLFSITNNFNSDYTIIDVLINNKNCDFYSKLLTEIGYYTITNGKNDSKLNIISKKDFQSYNDCVVNIQIPNGNYDIDINYIKRENYDWEGNVGYSIYHFFNNSESHIINNTLFKVSPLFFPYYDYSLYKDNFFISITFEDENSAKAYKDKLAHLKNCEFYNKIYLCLVDTDFSEFKKNKANTFPIFIGNNNVDIEFIFYSLDLPEKCKTKTE